MYNLIMISSHIYLIIIEHRTLTDVQPTDFAFILSQSMLLFFMCENVCVRVLNSFLILFMPISVGTPSF